MNKRYLGAILLSPLLIFLFLGGIYLKILTMILALLGTYEFYKVLKVKKINTINYVGYALCLIYYLTIGSNINYKLTFFILILALLLLLCIPIIDLDYNFLDVAATLLGFLYISVFFSFITLTSMKKYGEFLVWIIFISSWLCDTAAYYSGRYLGKHKLCPKISPKKTIEGSIGGLLGSIFGCFIFGIIIFKYGGVKIPIYHYIIIGLLSGILGQFGDLVASSIKRYVDVKDYSNLIPGHGGILDRFDSILFSSVVVFYYLTFILNI